MDDDLQARINSVTNSLKEFKSSLCKICKQRKDLNERRLCNDCEEERLARIAEARIPNDSGYIYVYDDTGRLVSEARTVMEKSLGRSLRSFEVVLRRNNERDNNSPDNLLLGLKNGTPIGNLRCNHCGTIGDFNLVEGEVSEVPD